MHKSFSESFRRVVALMLVLALCAGLIPQLTTSAKALSVNSVNFDTDTALDGASAGIFPAWRTGTSIAAYNGASSVTIYPDYDPYSAYPAYKITTSQIIWDDEKEIIKGPKGNMKGAFVVYRNIASINGREVNLMIKPQTATVGYGYHNDILFWGNHVGYWLRGLTNAFCNYLLYYADTENGSQVEAVDAKKVPVNLGIYDLDTTEYVLINKVDQSGTIYRHTNPYVRTGVVSNENVTSAFESLPGWTGNMYFAKSGLEDNYYYYNGMDSATTYTATGWNPAASSKDSRFKVAIPVTDSYFCLGYGSRNTYHSVEIGFFDPRGVSSPYKVVSADAERISSTQAKSDGIKFSISRQVGGEIPNVKTVHLEFEDKLTNTPLVLKDATKDIKIYNILGASSKTDVTGSFTVTYDAATKVAKAVCEKTGGDNMWNGGEFVMEITTYLDDSLSEDDLKQYMGIDPDTGQECLVVDNVSGESKASVYIILEDPVTLTIQKNVEDPNGKAPIAGWKYNIYAYLLGADGTYQSGKHGWLSNASGSSLTTGDISSAYTFVTDSTGKVEINGLPAGADLYVYEVEDNSYGPYLVKVSVNGGSETQISSGTGKEVVCKEEENSIRYTNVFDPDIPKEDDPTPVVSDKLYNVFWDQNYDGGGIAASLQGKWKMKFTLENTLSTIDGYDHAINDIDIEIPIEWAVPSDPVRPGFTFEGWCLENPNGTKSDALSAAELLEKGEPGKSVTYYAIWTPNTYTITWDANGGISTKTTSQNHGEKLEFPSAPTRTGYTFTGWYLYREQEASNEVSSDTIVDDDFTFYAGWNPEPVYVTYYDNTTGSSLVGTQEYKYGETLDILEGMRDTNGLYWLGWDVESTDQNPLVLDESVLKEHKGSSGVSNYWTLDIHGTWSQKSTSYTATVYWEDYANNDGARPTALKLGLVSSDANNSVVDTKVLSYDGQNSQSVTFTELPITIESDDGVSGVTADNEKVQYSVVLLSYTDVAGETFTIQDTAAASGTLTMASKASTISATDKYATTYRYAIDNHGAVLTSANPYSTSITMAHSNELTGTDISFTIEWDDDSDNDGVRPGAVMLGLFDDTKLVDWKNVSSADCKVSEDGNTWTYVFRDYQMYRSGAVIDYTVSVLSDDRKSVFSENGYVTSHIDSKTKQSLATSATGAIIRRNMVLADQTATIYWDDHSNRDGQRPESVTVTLYRYEYVDGVLRQTAELDSKTVKGDTTKDAWTVDFGDYPVTVNGRQAVYLALVTSNLNAQIPADQNQYSLSSAGLNITASRIANTGSVSAEILWEDNDNNDNLRPASVAIQLYRNGTEKVGNAVLLTERNGWAMTWKDLTIYNESEEGKLSQYSVKVTLPSGYTDIYTPTYTTIPDGNKLVITLTHNVELLDRNVTIHWDDESNRDGYRPSEVDVNLYAYEWNAGTYKWEENFVETAHLAGDVTEDVWTYTFAQLPVYHDSVKIIYRAYISSDLNAHVPENSKEYTSVTNNLDITVSHDRDVKSLETTVEWDDAQDNDHIRPTSVILQLYADGEELTGKDYAVILSGDAKADTWSHTFEDLPIYKKGEEGVEILYTVAVKEAVKNSVYGSYISTANGQEEELIRYTASYMDENGVTTAVLSESFYPYVRLSHNINQSTITLYASWHDEQNRDGKRPDSVLFDLYKQVAGERTYVGTYNVTAGPDGSWQYVIGDLPVSENGHDIIYLVELSADCKRDLENNHGYNTAMEGTTAHLYYTPETGSVTASINWQDNQNNDNLRPDSVTATLYANGKSTGQTLPLSKENDYTATWKNLYAYYKNEAGAVGQEIVYTVMVDTPEQYTESYTPASTTTVNPQVIYINLTHGTNTRSVDVTVYWDDDSNNDEIRPAALNVQLYANGEKISGKTASLTGDGDIWNYTFDDLPIYENGKEIYYSVYPNDNITKTYSSMTAGTDLYLSYNNQKANLQVSFRFDDNQDADGIRPSALYLTLTANGQPVDEADYQRTVFFDVDGASWTFYNLPVYSMTGEKIRYNAVATLNAEYGSVSYDISYSKNIELSTNGNINQIVVSLSKSYDTGMETGHIYWFDNDDQRGNRPSSLTVDVYNDASTYVVGTYVIDAMAGTVTDAYGSVVGTVRIQEWGADGASCWTYSIDGLRQNAIYAGETHEIYYYASARATGISNWYTVLDGKTNGLDVNLTHTNYAQDRPTSLQDFNVTVSWLDNENAWGYRPNAAGVTVTLYANGNTYKTIHLDEGNTSEGNSSAWTYTFKDLPTYLSGAAVVWSAGIEDVDTYIAIEENTSGYAVLRMEQSMGFDVRVNWADSENDDAVRPQSVSLDVYGDGVKIGEIRLTGAGETWTGSADGFCVWRRTDSDAAVEYTFRWSEETLQILRENGYSAAAVKNGVAVDADTFYYLSTEVWGEAKTGLNARNRYQVETMLSRSRDTVAVFADVSWDDENDRDAIRPDHVMVQLYADGIPAGDPIRVDSNGTNTWNAVWEAQFENSGGSPIVYTAEVVETPEGYVNTKDPTGQHSTLIHLPYRVDVSASVSWDDDSQINNVYNSMGTLINSYREIQRTDIWLQLYQNGVAYGEPVYIPSSDYGEFGSGSMTQTAEYTWRNLYLNDAGSANRYSFRIVSDDLEALMKQNGYRVTYQAVTPVYQDTATDADDPKIVGYTLGATITHFYYDISGTVYYRYNQDEFLLKSVPVTVYLYNENRDTYIAVGSSVTDANGHFDIDRLPQGLLIVRAVYTHDGYIEAGSKGIELDRCNVDDIVITINRDAEADSNLYTYSATGKAYYQTDKKDYSTITPVPEGSYVVLYRMDSDTESLEFAQWAKTDTDGAYSFTELPRGTYLVNVIFSYNDGIYTYDNSDAVRDGIQFVIDGENATWPDIVKQVNPQTPVGPEPDPEPGEDPPQENDGPKPCVVTGSVFYSYDGIHSEDPIENIDVYFYASGSNALVAETNTTADGNWNVDGIGIGDYIAVFSMQGSASRVYLFSVTELQYQAKAEIEIPNQYFDISTTGATAIISGVALDEQGNQMSCLVQLLDEHGDLVGLQYTDPSGCYQFIVPAGYTYRVILTSVGSSETDVEVGDPDDALTDLNHFIVSGKFSIDGTPQSGQLVTLNTMEADGSTVIRSAAITDSEGNYQFTVTNPGNYRIVTYIDDEIYGTYNRTVGYQEYEPTVQRHSDVYNITGFAPDGYDTAVLYNVSGSVRRVVKEIGTPGSSYAFVGLPAGEYELHLIKSGVETIYYHHAPETVAVSYTVDIRGAAVPGSWVTLQRSDGTQEGDPVLVTNGAYAFLDVPAGNYIVHIVSPTKGTVLANKTTRDTDSYGNSYPEGISANHNWVWNLHAVTVSGTVTDQNGDPIGGAKVILKNIADETVSYGIVTKADGTYKAGVAPGTYLISAMYEVNENHIYHSARNITVSAAEDRDQVDLIILRYTLSGTVVRDSDSNPIPDIPVTVKLPGGTVVWEGVTDAKGQFDTVLFADTYVITVSGDAGTVVRTMTLDADSNVTLKLTAQLKISGVVYEQGSREPIRDAIVYYDGPIAGRVYTDKNGTYAIILTSDHAGSYRMYAEAAGRQSQYINVAVFGDTTQDFALSAAETGSYLIAGVVTDNDGNRLENVVVTLRYGDDKTRTMRTATNRSGEYRFYVTEKGTYYITAVYEAPNGYTYSTNSETVVHMTDGDETGRNIALALLYDVTVHVIDTDGKAVSGATVAYAGAAEGNGLTDENGAVVLRIPGGDYEFTVSAGNRTLPKQTLTVNGPTELTVVIGKPGLAEEKPTTDSKLYSITGYVIDPDGNPVDQADVVLYRFNDVSETWEPVEMTRSDSKGYYEFTKLEPGRYRVDVSYTLEHYTDTSATNFEIKGYAKDPQGNPYIAAQVNLYDEHGTKIRTTSSDGSGYYEFLNLNAGNYTVEIIPEENDADTITKNNVEAEPSNTVIEGVVVDMEGNPVQGATVTVTADDGASWSMATDEDGRYSFGLPAAGSYLVTIVYPRSDEKHTDDADRGNDTDASELEPTIISDHYTISGYVHDTDGHAIEGATVVLKDRSGNELARTRSNSDGFYEFTGLKPGSYIVEVLFSGMRREYPVETEKQTQEEPKPDDTPKLHIAGIVITDHKTPLKNAVVTITNLDSMESLKLRTDQDGKFRMVDLEQGRYQVSASYAHNKGENLSDPVFTTKSTDQAVLVITLCYAADVNGDGQEETVYAGNDDTFDTADDFYQADIDNDGILENVYAGGDSRPGTQDDYYLFDTDHDGEAETVYVGPDRIPGTDDDYYLKDPDRDGDLEQIFAGEDGVPGTEDDWYFHDADGDGTDEIIHVGPDDQPGTEDDWYEKDVNDDGEPETVHVGPDGIPGTEDDWYEKDEDGNGTPERHSVAFIKITFHANGGTVNGETTFVLLRSRIKTLPAAIRDGYYFDGWYTARSGGDKIESIDSLQAFQQNTTLYARWTESSTAPSDNQVYVTFHGNGGMVHDSATYTVKLDDISVLPAAVRSGHVFGGWFTARTGGKQITEGSQITRTVTLYAHWTKEGGGPADDPTDPDNPDTQIKITFHASGGTVYGATSFTAYLGNLPTLPTATYSGHTLVGWFTERNGAGAQIITIAELAQFTEDTTLYAYWKSEGTGNGNPGGGTGGGNGGGNTTRNPTFTFHGAGGTINGKETWTVKLDSIKELPIPERTGYEFSGWYTDRESGSRINSVVELKQFSQDVSLYAHWTVSIKLTTEHIAYVIGDDHGMVNPDHDMTRAEAVTVFYRLLDSEYRKTVETNVSPFTDVTAGSWYCTEVSTLAKAGIVNGKGNHIFDPNAPITRAEFATIAARFSQKTDFAGTDQFTDISKSWAREYINIAAELGYVHGYGDGTYRPSNNITRAEAIQLINNVLGRSNLAQDSLLVDQMKTWPDNSDPTKWYYLAIQEATNGHTSSFAADGKETWTKLTDR